MEISETLGIGPTSATTFFCPTMDPHVPLFPETFSYIPNNIFFVTSRNPFGKLNFISGRGLPSLSATQMSSLIVKPLQLIALGPFYCRRDASI